MVQLTVRSQLAPSLAVGAAVGNPSLNLRITRNLTMTAAVGAATGAAHFYLANITDRFSGSADAAAIAPRTIRMTNRLVENDADYQPKDEF